MPKSKSIEYIAAAVVVLPFVPVIPMIFIFSMPKISDTSLASRIWVQPLFLASCKYLSFNFVRKNPASLLHLLELSVIKEKP